MDPRPSYGHRGPGGVPNRVLSVGYSQTAYLSAYLLDYSLTYLFTLSIDPFLPTPFRLCASQGSQSPQPPEDPDPLRTSVRIPTMTHFHPFTPDRDLDKEVTHRYFSFTQRYHLPPLKVRDEGKSFPREGRLLP